MNAHHYAHHLNGLVDAQSIEAPGDCGSDAFEAKEWG